MSGDKRNQPLIFSIFLHIALLAIMYFGLPDISNKETEELVISLEDLPISDISNVKQQEQKKENLENEEVKSNREVPKSQKEEKVAEKPKEEEKEITPKKTEEKPKEEKPVQEDVISKPKDLETPKKPETKQEEKPKEKDKDKEKPKDKPIKPKPDNKKTNKNDEGVLDSLLKTLESPREKNTDEEIKKNKEAKSINQKGQKKSQGKYNENLPLSLSERDSIGNQIYNSWYFQAGAKDSKEMFVILRISVDIDGVVGNIEILDINKYNNSSNAYRVFVDSAIRAVKKASPFQGLSKERYNAWRELELNFDPRGVIF